MDENATEQLGPPSLKIAGTEQTYSPYRELKEKLGPQKYDAVVVFGEGPIKRVFFSDEEKKFKEIYKDKPEIIERWEAAQKTKPPTDLPPDQLIKWLGTKGPRTELDPDFTVIDIKQHGASSTHPDLDINEYHQRMKEIENLEDPELRNQKREEFRAELENKGRHSYKRYGELNALAAGLLLYTGKTDLLILSGGRTIPGDKIKTGLGFPSEAELMRDLIIRNFGNKMFERDNPDVILLANSDLPEEKEEYNQRYKDYLEKTIHKYFKMEEEATNSIDNVIRSINHSPEIFFNSQTAPEIGLLGNNHQVERVVTLLQLFTGNETGSHPISAQNDVLKPFADIRNKSKQKGFFPELLRYMTDEETNRDLQEKTRGEAAGREKLKKPEDMFWWLGYIAHSNVPEVFQTIMKKLADPNWIQYSKRAFMTLAPNLRFEDYQNADFTKEPDKMKLLKEKFELILIKKLRSQVINLDE